MSKCRRASLLAPSNSRMMEHTLHLSRLSGWHKKRPPAILRSQLTLKVRARVCVCGCIQVGVVCVCGAGGGGGGEGGYFISSSLRRYLITGMTTVLTEEEEIDNDKSVNLCAPVCVYKVIMFGKKNKNKNMAGWFFFFLPPQGCILPACLQLQHWSTLPTLVFADGFG